MTKKIAVLNDLSGLGRCSLTAAVSVISAMGVQPCPLPTAILTAQTGYPSYYCDDYTDKIDVFRNEWEKLNIRFDGIYTGFMSDVEQIKKVHDFLDVFYKKDVFLLVDPVMGDNGERFPIFSYEFQNEIKRLVYRADIVTPNITELCLLTDTDSRMIKVMTDEKYLITIAEQMAKNILSKGPKAVIVTGITYSDKETGQQKMGNLTVTRKKTTIAESPKIGGSYSGTGDLFASVIAGGKARGDRLEDAVELAGRLIEHAISDSVNGHVPRNEGVDYEKYLWMLTEKNRPDLKNR